MFASIFKKLGSGSPAHGDFSQIFQQLCDVREVMNPDLNKNIDKCFSQFRKIGQGSPCTRQVAVNFSMFSGCFHHSAKFMRLTVGFLRFVDYRIQRKSTTLTNLSVIFPCSMFCKKFMYTGTSLVWAYAELFQKTFLESLHRIPITDTLAPAIV